MTDFTLRQLQKKLEKDKTETEWKLKEYGWRLDQASAVSFKQVENLPPIIACIVTTGFEQS